MRIKLKIIANIMQNRKVYNRKIKKNYKVLKFCDFKVLWKTFFSILRSKIILFNFDN